MRQDKALLLDISDAINSIDTFLYGKGEKEFFESDLIQSAVIKKLEIIGEAVKNLSKELKDKYKEVSWKNITGMRDILIHGYFGIKMETVWETVKIEIPKLKIQIREILEKENWSKNPKTS